VRHFAALQQVLGVIAAHVLDGVAHFRRRLQDARVIAVGEDFAFAPQRAIDGAREANDQALQPARQRLFAVGLDDQVDVIGLH
jgi:hypothetical protein